MALIPLEEAQKHIFEQISCLSAAEVAVDEALGLVTAQDIASPEPIPAWDNTAMDGFAVRSSDTIGASEQTPVVLEVVGTLPAGAQPETSVQQGQAIRIMTGAPMPPGADSVVQVELTRSSVGTTSLGATSSNSDSPNPATAPSEAEQVEIFQQVQPGTHIRRAGEDLTAGQLAVPAQTCLTPAPLGVLSSIGVTKISAYPKPRVAVFSTGDELISDGSPLEVGQIRDSNRIAIISLAQEAQCEPINGGVIPDDETAIGEAFLKHAQTCDAIITTGGVSMGDYDYVKVVLDRIGQMRWMQIAIRPAKPLAFGTVSGTPVFGLPGNPVSCMVSFELFARPALRKMAGHTQIQRLRRRGIAAEALPRRSDGKTHFARVSWNYSDGQFWLRSAGGQGSHQLSGMAAANGLAVLADSDGIAQGEEVEFIQLGG